MYVLFFTSSTSSFSLSSDVEVDIRAAELAVPHCFVERHHHIMGPALDPFTAQCDGGVADFHRLDNGNAEGRIELVAHGIGRRRGD